MYPILTSMMCEFTLFKDSANPFLELEKIIKSKLESVSKFNLRNRSNCLFRKSIITTSVFSSNESTIGGSPISRIPTS